jgi:hypothetical protein
MTKIPGSYPLILYLRSGGRFLGQWGEQLFTEKRDRTDVRNILRLPKQYFQNWPHCSFAVSPDELRTRFNNVGNEMWESALDGSNQHRILTEHKETMCCGIWAPDGKLFVFSSEGRERDNLWAVTEGGFPFYRLVFSAGATHRWSRLVSICNRQQRWEADFRSRRNQAGRIECSRC